jgi:bla regulator protein BlaR1
MNLINSIISENLINALGWTILHSLWQGALLALGFALVLFFMRRQPARTRYGMGVMALMLILALSVVTFVSLYAPGAERAAAVTGEEGTELALTGAANTGENVTLVAFFKNYFNRHLPLVVTLWMLGVLVLVLRLAGGYLYNQRLKVLRNQPLPASWQNRLETFCRRMGIRKPIGLVESALVKVPMTIGHFKPVILFPVGLVTGLPRDQVEALLAHELAHILRKDYLVNILQNLADILFFYHPGVRWISSLVRTEREHCCDDMAVSLSGDSINVARALTNVQTGNMRTLDPAMAAAGRGPGSYSLLARIKRLLRPPAVGSDFAAGAVGASILVVGLLTLFVSANAATALNRDMAADNSPAKESVLPATADEDRDKEIEKKKKEKLLQIESLLKAEKMAAKKYKAKLLEIKDELKKQNREAEEAEKEKIARLEKELQMREMKMKELEKLRQHLVQGRVQEQEQELKEIEKERMMEEMEAKLNAEKMSLKREMEELLKKEEALRRQNKELDEVEKKKLDEMKKKLQLLSIKEKKVKEMFLKQEIEMRKHEEEMRKQEVEMHKEAEEMRKQEVEMRAQEEKMREHEAQMRKQEIEMQAQEEELRKQEAEMKKQEIEMQAQEEKMREHEAQMRKQEEEMQKHEAEIRKQEEKLRKQEEFIMKVLVKELLHDKLIADAGEFEFLFKDGELYINGQKQPAAVYKKYRELYEKASGRPLESKEFRIVKNR